VRTDSQPPAHRPAENGGLDRLTSRELEVLALLVDGLQQQEIAEALSISTRQVRRHVASACERTGVRNDNQLATLAVRVGLFRSRVTI
jgi:DNA-binding NarL/FixJ family response regulator